MQAVVPVVTVDGPSGVGKGTLCQALAQQFGWHLLDSGAIYRVLALAALKQNSDLTDQAALLPVAISLDVSFFPQPSGIQVVLATEDVSQKIREEHVGNAASQIATFPKIRDALLQRQRAFRQAPGLIADGRDMGTVVFPDAPVKIFLDASAEERAIRRMRQLQEKGFSVNFERLLAEIQERDYRDRNRPLAPLVPADDALLLDSTALSIDQVISRSLAYIQEKLC